MPKTIKDTVDNTYYQLIGAGIPENITNDLTNEAKEALSTILEVMETVGDHPIVTALRNKQISILEEKIRSQYPNEYAAYEKSQTDSCKTNDKDISKPEMDGNHFSSIDEAIETITPLYEYILDMSGIDDEEKLRAYKEFIDAYGTTIYNDSGTPISDVEREQIDIRIGIPPAIFPDMGTEFVSLIADKFAAMVNETDQLSPNDARAALEEKGAINPSADEIEYKLLQMKYDGYEAAETTYMDIGFITKKGYISADNFEQMAGISGEYLDLQFEIIKSDRESLSHRHEPIDISSSFNQKAPDNDCSISDTYDIPNNDRTELISNGVTQIML